jgi:AcrR family transcriptional regulator
MTNVTPTSPTDTPTPDAGNPDADRPDAPAPTPGPGGRSAPSFGHRPANRRERSPRGEGEQLRTELLSHALELLSESGNPDDVSIRAIARRTGVSATAAYRHFVDRDDLVYCAVGATFEDFSASLSAAVAAADGPFEALAAAGRAYRTYAAEQPGRYRVLFSNPMSCPDTTSATDEEIDAGSGAFDMLVALVQDALDAGAPAGPDADATYLAFQLWSWIHGMVDLRITHPDAPWPDLDTMFVDAQAILGLGPPDAA